MVSRTRRVFAEGRRPGAIRRRRRRRVFAEGRRPGAIRGVGSHVVSHVVY